MVLKKRAILLGLMWPLLNGFLLIDGENKSRLPSNILEPTIYFSLGTDLPPVQDKGEFLDGQYAGLSNEEFWPAMVREAMRPWNDAPGSHLVLELDETEAAVENEHDGTHSITVSSLNVTSSASARPTVEGSTIIDCDILISSTNNSAPTVGYALMHELGHCLGLGHSHTNYNAVMGYARTDRELTLGADDIAGVVYLYPDPDHANSVEMVNCGSIGPLTKGESTIVFALLLLPLLMVGRRWSHKD